MTRRRTYNKRGAIGNSGQFIYAAPAKGYLMRSDNFGESFYDLDSLGNSEWGHVALSGDGATVLAAFSVLQYTLISRDFGITWSEIENYSLRKPNCIAISGDGKIIIAGDVYGANLSTDSGITWTSAVNGLDERIYDAVISSTGQHIILAGRYNIFQSSDFGASFQKSTLTPTTSVSWDIVAMSSDGKHRIAINSSESPKISNDQGISWSNLSSAPSGFNKSADISDDGKHITLGKSSGLIYVSSDSGKTFQPMLEKDAWLALAMSSSGKHQIAGASINSMIGLHLSDNFGESFRRVAQGAYKSVAINK